MENFTIKYWYDLNTRQYIAEIPELNISDYGETMNEANINLQAWLNLYFEEVTSNLKTNKQEMVYA